jgi:hypothetical protein
VDAAGEVDLWTGSRGESGAECFQRGVPSEALRARVRSWLFSIAERKRVWSQRIGEEWPRGVGVDQVG